MIWECSQKKKNKKKRKKISLKNVLKLKHPSQQQPPKTDLTKLIVLSQQIILLLDFSNEVAKIMLPYLGN